MSAINKEPFLVKVLKTLSSTDAATLKSLANGSDQVPDFICLQKIAGQHYITGNDKGVSYVLLDIGGIRAQKQYEGYLVYNNTYCVLFYFTGRTQQNMGIMKIDPEERTCSFINVPLTILEFRSELNDVMANQGLGITVQADDIDSGDVGAGKALISTADGGAEWGNMPTLSVGDIINLGTINVSKDGENPAEAYFSKTITSTEFNAIPDSGLCIFMFNTTCVIFPYIKQLQENRFVINAIYDASGNTKVVRASMKVMFDVEGNAYYISVNLDNTYAENLYEVPSIRPYAIVRFIGL